MLQNKGVSESPQKNTNLATSELSKYATSQPSGAALCTRVERDERNERERGRAEREGEKLEELGMMP